MLSYPPSPWPYIVSGSLGALDPDCDITIRRNCPRGHMETLLLPFSPRFIILTICAVVTALLIAVGIFDHNVKVWEVITIPIVIFGALTVLGLRDLTQKSHAVLRNYPISAHIRFLLE